MFHLALVLSMDSKKETESTCVIELNNNLYDKGTGLFCCYYVDCMQY